MQVFNNLMHLHSFGGLSTSWRGRPFHSHDKYNHTMIKCASANHVSHCATPDFVSLCSPLGGWYSAGGQKNPPYSSPPSPSFPLHPYNPQQPPTRIISFRYPITRIASQSPIVLPIYAAIETRRSSRDNETIARPRLSSHSKRYGESIGDA